MINATAIPNGQAICPCCNGTKIGAEMSAQEKKWWPGRTHFNCRNCGGQTMGQNPLGYTLINPKTGLGCTHTFDSTNAGRCYTKHRCIEGCGYEYAIDSGD